MSHTSDDKWIEQLKRRQKRTSIKRTEYAERANCFSGARARAHTHTHTHTHIYAYIYIYTYTHTHTHTHTHIYIYIYTNTHNKTGNVCINVTLRRVRITFVAVVKQL